MKFLAGFIIALGLCFGGYIYFGPPLPKFFDKFKQAEAVKGDSQPAAPAAAEGDKERLLDLDRRAEMAAREHVREFLDAPLDADSPWAPAEVAHGSRNGQEFFWVASTVKEKNASGAPPTRAWKAKLTYDGNQFSLARCEIDGKPVFPPDAVAAANPPDAIETDQDASRASLQDELRKTDVGPTAATKRSRDPQEKKAKAALRRPEAAASMLNSAKNFKASGKEDLYRKWLQKVVTDFPETDAAKEAKSLLGE